MNDAEIALSEFESKVEVWLLRSLSKGPKSFSELVASLPGVYPTYAISGVHRLVERGIIPVELGEKLAQQAMTEFCPVSTYSMLPPPHPLDFEWRFDQETSEAIAKHAVKYSARTFGRTLIFGAPTVALAAIKLGLERHAAFVGENNEVLWAVSQYTQERASSLTVLSESNLPTSGLYANVVLDPPWYDDCIEEMVPLAALACRIDGRVLMVAAPMGARIAALEHRKKLLSLAEQCGLVLADRLPAFARYQTPLFEANALKAAGLAAPGDWRTADLLEFRKVDSNALYIPSSRPRPRQWRQVSFGRMRVFIDLSEPDKSGPNVFIKSVVSGDILSTVSRNEGERTGANVWTSGNRVFWCNRPNELASAFSADTLSNSKSYNRYQYREHNPINFHQLASLKFQMQRLSVKELQEEQEYFGKNHVAPQRITQRT